MAAVVRILSKRKMRGPVVLLGISEAAEVLFEGLIYPLGLSIGLRVVGSAVGEMDAKGRHDFLPEGCEELSPPIGDNIARYPMLGEDVGDE